MGAPEVVVLDTNVLVSALGWRGPELRMYRLCRQGVFRMSTTHALLIELGRVLAYPKFDFTPAEIGAFLSQICSHAMLVVPTEAVDVCEDPADNRVLDCAAAARASWIVSGDADLLGLGEYRGIRIVRAAELSSRF